MKKLIILIAFLTMLSAHTSAQTKVNVRFARGTTSATVRGTVTGYKYIDYRVGAREGQMMSVSLKSTSQFAQFVIFDPSMENLEGSTGETSWSGELPTNGTYTVRVMLPRSEARRKGSMANYSVKISIS